MFIHPRERNKTFSLLKFYHPEAIMELLCFNKIFNFVGKANFTGKHNEQRKMAMKWYLFFHGPISCSLLPWRKRKMLPHYSRRRSTANEIFINFGVLVGTVLKLPNFPIHLTWPQLHIRILIKVIKVFLRQNTSWLCSSLSAYPILVLLYIYKMLLKETFALDYITLELF